MRTLPATAIIVLLIITGVVIGSGIRLDDTERSPTPRIESEREKVKQQSGDDQASPEDVPQPITDLSPPVPSASAFVCGDPAVTDSLVLPPGETVPGANPAVKIVRADSTTHILIDVPQRRLYLFKGTDLVKSYPVAVGKTLTPSPIGDWTIIAKKSWGEGFGTRWMQLDVPWGIYGIHGTTRPYSIGSFASGGCIRMFNRDVENLFDRVDVGTTVTLRGNLFAGLEWRRTLVPGVTHHQVYYVQKVLTEKDYYHGPVDGVYNEQTEEAVKAFQRDNGIQADGHVHTQTYDALGLFPFE